MSAVGLSFRKPVYVAEGKLKFERANATLSITNLGREIGNMQPLADKSNPITTEVEVMRSQPMIQQTIDQLGLRQSMGAPLSVNEFLEKLQVSAIKETDILILSYQDFDPAQATEVVNTLMSLYLEHNVYNHRAQAVAARRFIEQQLPHTETTVKQAEDNLRQFKQANQVIALSEESTSAVKSLSELQGQIAVTQTQLKDADAQIMAYQNQLGMNAQRASESVSLSQSQGVQSALAEAQKLETELSAQRTVLQPNHPKIVNLESRLANARSLLQQRSTQLLGRETPFPDRSWQIGILQQDIAKTIVDLNSKRNGLAQQLATLYQIEAEYRKRTDLFPGLEKEQRELERQLEASQSTYAQLLQKMGEIGIAENQTIGNARIMAAAQLPTKPVSNTAAFLAAGLLGLLGAGATAYGLEVFDQTIKTVEQAKQVLGFTVLGVIPDANKRKQPALQHSSALHHSGEELPRRNIVVEQSPSSAIGAAYRILQTNLKFSSSQPLRVIVVSSAVPKEGKSTVSANLAAAIAQSGKRVILIDADLHCPSQHQIWAISNDVGLSHLLVEEAAFGKAAKCVTSNLDVLTAGVMPPNTLALLDSQRMSTLIEELAENYDTVILDTPPLNLATDALILGKMANGILMVVRPGLTNVGSAGFARELLEQSGQTVLGQAINGFVAANEPHSHYYFSDNLDGRGLYSTKQ
ncbi:GumC family protein [Myxacorys almedinensis]